MHKIIKDSLPFSEALEALKTGQRVARKNWNGKDMWIALVPGSHWKADQEPWLTIFGKDALCEYEPHIDMYTADKKLVPWLASQTDLLSDDWQIITDLGEKEWRAINNWLV